jgi:alanine racemase
MNLSHSLEGKRPTWIEVDLGHLEANFRALRGFLPGHVKIMPVIKADAYGHGAVAVARRLELLKADALAVAILEEALVLRSAGVGAQLLLLSGFWPGQEDQIVESKLVPAIHRLELLDILEQAASRARRRASYHLKIDTGMSRLGVELEQALAFLQKGSPGSWTCCDGLYTHLSSAEDPDSASTAAQLQRFERVLAEAQRSGVSVPWRHSANSAGLLNHKRSWFNGVRPGLILYGVNPLPRALSEFRIMPVLSFKTCVMQMRRVAGGSSIGYGDAYTLNGDRVIATLPVGYADGLMRSLSNRGQVLVCGERAPIVGRISMDLTMIDVTDIPSVQIGDEVVLIGRQGKAEIRVEDVAQLAGTIPYETLCRMGTRVPRIYIDSSQEH